MRQGNPGTPSFLLGDHLGSTSITANSSGSKIAELRYHSWGGTRYTSGTTPTARRFTGQIDDYYIKLYHMGARMYDPELGRFISPDSIVPNPADPQSLNRYSYCLNNPLKYIDPNGHEPISVIIVIGIAIFKAVDYGWTAYDMWQSGRVLSNPNASRGDKLLAGLNIGLGALLEAAEPDDALPVGVPLDDVGRRAMMKTLREAYEEGGEEAVERVLRETLGDQADDVLEYIGKEAGDDGINLWPGPGAGRQTIDGITYSQHALEQMMPSGLGGRGVPPSVVQNALLHGSRSTTRDAGVVRIVYENVTVLWNEVDQVVVTVIKTGH